MGKWAKHLFDEETFGEVGIVIGGSNSQEFQDEILKNFDEVLSSKDKVYHGYLARKNNKTYPVVFNVYGAPAMVDVLAHIQDGGCRNVIFVGYSYAGFTNLDIGKVILVDRSYHYHGLYHKIEPDRHADYPDKELFNKVEQLLRKNTVDYVKGTNISVPAVTLQPKHDNPEYKKIKPLSVEMELASCYARAKDLGVRTTGALIVSDNRESSITKKTDEDKSAKRRVLEILIQNIESLNLPSLDKGFNISEYLASIIHDPENSINVYRVKKEQP